MRYVWYLRSLADLANHGAYPAERPRPGFSLYRRSLRPGVLRESSGGTCVRALRPGTAHAIAPFTRSVTTLSSSAINRKRLGQRFGRISVSDQSHCGHGSRARPRRGTVTPTVSYRLNI